MKRKTLILLVEAERINISKKLSLLRIEPEALQMRLIFGLFINVLKLFSDDFFWSCGIKGINPSSHFFLWATAFWGSLFIVTSRHGLNGNISLTMTHRTLVIDDSSRKNKEFIKYLAWPHFVLLFRLLVLQLRQLQQQPFVLRACDSFQLLERLLQPLMLHVPEKKLIENLIEHTKRNSHHFVCQFTEQN